MGLVPMNELLHKAQEGRYAVGYFESWDLASLRAVINAAEETRSPVIIGFNGGILTNTKRLLKPENLEYYAAIGKIAAQNTWVPVSFMLNEAPTFELAILGIRLGFNAVMFECELEDFDEYKSLASQLVNVAHAVGVAVEANVGQLPTADRYGLRQRTPSESLTDPEDARRFVQATDIDILGVSIGNVEVLMDGKATMNFDLLKQIKSTVDIPLTLHGGSGIADEDVKKLIESGLCKMNIGTALNHAFLEGMKRIQKSGNQGTSPKYRIGSGLKEDIMAGGEVAMKELVKEKMKVYGSAGKADNMFS